jgi:hypothetical protein
MSVHCVHDDVHRDHSCLPRTKSPTLLAVNELVRFALSAYFPRVDDLPGLDDLGVDEKIAQFRRETTRLFWLGIVMSSLFFQIAPLLTLKRPWLAAWLTPEELDQHAHLLTSHPWYLVRQMPMMLKLIGGMFWAQSPEIRAFAGLAAYPPDPGTRRTEAVVPRFVAPTRQISSDKLIELGRRERTRGREYETPKGLQA